jgi:hypothetical protein
LQYNWIDAIRLTKYTCPDVRQPWSRCAFIKEGNCRFDFNRQDD